MKLPKLFILYVILPSLFFPLYFILVNAADSLIGTQSLLYTIDFENKKQLIKTFFEDWLLSLPIMFGLFYFMIVSIYYFTSKIKSNPVLITMVICIVLMVFITYLFGFRGTELVLNGLLVAIFIGLYAHAKKAVS